jgi:hypothetical protein
VYILIRAVRKRLIVSEQGLLMVRSLLIAAAALASTACSSSECVVPPCLAPIAVSLQLVSAATSTPVTGLVEVTGAVQTSFQCAGVCQIAGGRGTYHVRITASGYAAVEQDVSVSGTERSCGCPTVETASVVVRLTT